MRNTELSAFRTGLLGRCLRCGEGSVFDGFLEFAKSCTACGLNLDIEDAGDGPAVFVIFIVGICVAPFAVIFQLMLAPPVWLTMLIWSPILLISCLALLRPMRGIMLNLQIKNSAQEGQIQTADDKSIKSDDTL